MAFAPLFDPTQQFMARSGAPLAGGLLYVYRNTSQSLATLKNVAGTTIANPVSLDADGRAAGGVFVSDASTYTLVVKDAFDATLWTIAAMSPLVGGGAGGSEVTITPTITTGTKIADYSIDGEAGELFAPNAANLTFVAGGSSGGGSVTKTITLPHKYKNAFGGFISFVVKSSSSGLTRTVNWEYTIAGSGISYEVGKGQTIVVNYEAKVTMPFIVSSGVPFDQIVIKFTGTSADTSIYDADVFFYAEEVVES